MSLGLGGTVVTKDDVEDRSDTALASTALSPGAVVSDMVGSCTLLAGAVVERTSFFGADVP